MTETFQDIDRLLCETSVAAAKLTYFLPMRVLPIDDLPVLRQAINDLRGRLTNLVNLIDTGERADRSDWDMNDPQDLRIAVQAYKASARETGKKP